MIRGIPEIPVVNSKKSLDFVDHDMAPRDAPRTPPQHMAMIGRAKSGWDTGGHRTGAVGFPNAPTSAMVWAKDEEYFGDDFFWLVVWNITALWLSIYWEFHHPNWRTPSFFKIVKTTNQMMLK